MSGLEVLPLLAMAGSTVSAVGTLASGAAANSSAEYQAQQYRQEATQAIAAGQRDAFGQEREKNKLIGAQIAAGAASGPGGISDTSTLGLIGETEQQGLYRQMAAMYAGEERARGLRNQAQASIAEGKNAQMASYLNAGGTLLQGASKMGSPMSWEARYGTTGTTTGASYG